MRVGNFTCLPRIVNVFFAKKLMVNFKLNFTKDPPFLPKTSEVQTRFEPMNLDLRGGKSNYLVTRAYLALAIRYQVLTFRGTRDLSTIFHYNLNSIFKLEHYFRLSKW